MSIPSFPLRSATFLTTTVEPESAETLMPSPSSVRCTSFSSIRSESESLNTAIPNPRVSPVSFFSTTFPVEESATLMPNTLPDNEFLLTTLPSDRPRRMASSSLSTMVFFSPGRS